MPSSSALCDVYKHTHTRRQRPWCTRASLKYNPSYSPALCFDVSFPFCRLTLLLSLFAISFSLSNSPPPFFFFFFLGPAFSLLCRLLLLLLVSSADLSYRDRIYLFFLNFFGPIIWSILSLHVMWLRPSNSSWRSRENHEENVAGEWSPDDRSEFRHTKRHFKYCCSV